LALAIAAAFVSSAAYAAGDRACDGPDVCCPPTLAEDLPEPQVVKIGVVLAGLYNVNEKAGTWDADYYLYEMWTPHPAFTPQTEIVNEVNRRDAQFDRTELRNGSCIRSRRLYSTLHSGYNLRRYPFDRQTLILEFSDAEYSSQAVQYAPKPEAAGLTDETREMLSSWKIESGLTYRRESRAFQWETNAPRYDYAIFKLGIRRHVTYHMIKFFLPLFVIVSLAFLVFWIDPEDLSSQVQVGVTCVLSAIAFQFVQTNTLPEVAYTTLTDRVYVICYLAIALALALAVHACALARNRNKTHAVEIVRRCRWLFPSLTTLSLAVVVVWSFVRG